MGFVPAAGHVSDLGSSKQHQEEHSGPYLWLGGPESAAAPPPSEAPPSGSEPTGGRGPAA